MPEWGGKTFGVNIPKIPRLADGGVVTARPGGILANIGEGRYDEAVIPLSPSVLDSLGGGGEQGRPVTVEQTIYTQETDASLGARQWAREVQRGLAEVPV